MATDYKNTIFSLYIPDNCIILNNDLTRSKQSLNLFPEIQITIILHASHSGIS